MSSESEGIRSECIHTPSRFCEWAWFDSFDPHAGKAAALALATARRLVSGEVKNLLLSGPPGCGKTFLASATCNEVYNLLARATRQARGTLDASTDPAERARLTRQLKSADAQADRECPRWVSVPTFLPMLRREIAGEWHASYLEESRKWQLRDAVESSGLVVLDDLGAERASEWTIATLMEVVASRYDQGCGGLLVTSNLSARELVGAGYRRIVSRLQEDGVLLEMKTARDYRARLRKPLAVPLAEVEEA